jgi:hypothetical protein
MKNKVRITREQIQSMHDHLSGMAFPNKQQKRDLKIFYNLLTPKEIYVKFTSYSLLPDNSIESEIIVHCIKPNGSIMNCVEQFDDLRQRMQFESNFIEVDLDANGNIVFV